MWGVWRPRLGRLGGARGLLERSVMRGYWRFGWNVAFSMLLLRFLRPTVLGLDR
jgi:hypothetical protein